jgi:hypothetical protein
MDTNSMYLLDKIGCKCLNKSHLREYRSPGKKIEECIDLHSKDLDGNALG